MRRSSLLIGSRRLGLISLGVLALGAIGAGPAIARHKLPFKFTVYNVVYQGSGSYSVDSESNDGTSSSSLKAAASFHWAAHYRLLVIDKAGSTVGAPATLTNLDAGTWSIDSQSSDGTSCSNSGGLEVAKGGGIFGTVQSGGKVPLRLIPGGGDFDTTGGSSAGGPCDTTSFWHDWVGNFSHVGTDDDQDPLTAFVTLTRKDERFGKLVVKVSNQTLAAPSLTIEPDCGSGDGNTCHQSFAWTGTVTFTKAKSRLGGR